MVQVLHALGHTNQKVPERVSPRVSALFVFEQVIQSAVRAELEHQAEAVWAVLPAGAKEPDEVRVVERSHCTCARDSASQRESFATLGEMSCAASARVRPWMSMLHSSIQRGGAAVRATRMSA